MSSAPPPEVGPGAAVPFGRIAVLGLGVIGGSLARALRSAVPDVRLAGWSPDEREGRAALEAGALTRVGRSWAETVADAELVILATPLEATLRMLGPVACTAPRAVVSDVASLKAPVAEVARAEGIAGRWVGAHPMAGSERSGFGASRADLFRGARVWLTAAPEAGARVRSVAALWEAVGGEPREAGAEDHDRRMALVSHLPQMLANLLADHLASAAVPVDELGPGGRDATRLAGSDPAMWSDLLAHAPPELPRALREVGAEVAALARRIEEGEIDPVRAMMARTRAWKEGAR